MTLFLLIMFNGNHLGAFCLAGLPGWVHNVARLALFGAILMNFTLLSTSTLINKKKMVKMTSFVLIIFNLNHFSEICLGWLPMRGSQGGHISAN